MRGPVEHKRTREPRSTSEPVSPPNFTSFVSKFAKPLGTPATPVTWQVFSSHFSEKRPAHIVSLVMAPRSLRFVELDPLFIGGKARTSAVATRTTNVLPLCAGSSLWCLHDRLGIHLAACVDPNNLADANRPPLGRDSP